MTRFAAAFAKPRPAPIAFITAGDGDTAAERIAPTLDKDKIIIIDCSGRGDKDVFTVADALGVEL